MYCEDSEATDIEHFYPKAVYPLKGFEWANYLLACSNCNSNYKRSLFPLDSDGRPLLINPMDEDPMEHLVLSLTTGKFIPVSDKGAESIKVFGLDRQVLEVGRRDAWAVLCALSLRYSTLNRSADSSELVNVVATLKNQSFSCVALYAIKYFVAGRLIEVASPEVVDAISDLHDMLR